MPIDPYLWRIMEPDVAALDLARSMRSRGVMVEDAARIEACASRLVRRRVREWHRIDRELWAALGYQDLGGES